MQIGIFDALGSASNSIDQMVANAAAARADGFASYWLPQIFGFETLSVLSIIGREVPDIELGTAVVPTYPRHPLTMAAEALTAQAASNGRLTLGIGLSHQVVIETLMGLSFDKPLRHMREYLAALMPLLADRTVAVTGETISVMGTLDVPATVPAPNVLVAALGPKMLQLAGEQTGGTVTWMTGLKTVEAHIAPTINAAAEAAGRPAPRVVVPLNVFVTDDEAGVRELVATMFEMYGHLPSYRAMFDREGAAGPADIAIVGNEATVRRQIEAVADTGATDFIAVEFNHREPERTRTRELLRSML